MNHVMCRQLSRTGDRRLTNAHGPVSVALTLDRCATAHAYRSRYTASQHQVVVRGVDDRVNLLIDEGSVDDQDSRRRDFSTSPTRLSRSLRVAFAMPFTPIDEMVSDAHATPHTSASCRPFGFPPVVNQRASIPPARASPAPV